MKTRKSIVTGIMALLAAGVSHSLKAQDNSYNNQSNKPSVHISVHKQVDKNGNIISYDSVYSYSYHGNSPDTSMMNSMFNNGNTFMQFSSPSFGAMPGFTNDPFSQGANQDMNMEDMQKMMDKEMQELIKNAGMPIMQEYYQAPACTPNAPKNRLKEHKRPLKKKTPKHNVATGGVQI